MDSLFSFPVGLFHPLQHAGLSRRSPSCRQHTQDTLCEFAVSLCMSLRASFFTNAPRSLKVSGGHEPALLALFAAIRGWALLPLLCVSTTVFCS